MTATPESAQFWSAQSATEKTLKTLRRRATLVFVLGLIFFVAAVSIFFVVIDGKFSAIESKVDTIRSTQVTNTRVNDAIGRCEVTTGDDFIFDILRLANGDVAGFKIPMACAALSSPKSKGSK